MMGAETSRSPSSLFLNLSIAVMSLSNARAWFGIFGTVAISKTPLYVQPAYANAVAFVIHAENSWRYRNTIPAYEYLKRSNSKERKSIHGNLPIYRFYTVPNHSPV